MRLSLFWVPIFLCAPLQAAEVPTVPVSLQPAVTWLEREEPATLDEQVRLSEIPAPPFAEAKRGDYMKARFLELGLQEVRVDAVGNVIGVRPGQGAGPRVLISAHLDTVFPIEIDVSVKREGTIMKGPGIADNARGLTVLLAMARVLKALDIKHQGPITFVANVGEEGLGDLRGVRHLYDVELKGKIDHHISLDGGDFRVATAAVGSLRYRILFSSAGGHSYGAFGLVNPIHALGRAINRIAQWEVPAAPKTTFNVGVISGGTSVNSISETATMEVDMRSESPVELAKLEAALRRDIDAAVEEENRFWAEKARAPFIRTTNAARPVVVKLEKIGDRPAGSLSERAPILAIVREVNASLGLKDDFAASSTDANIPISRGLSALNLSGGGASQGGHSQREMYDSTRSHLGTQRAFLVLLALAGRVETP